MPNKQFIEQYPLYRKLPVKDLSATTDYLPKVRINMACKNCKSHQTFTMRNEYWEIARFSNIEIRGLIFRMQYVCTHCDAFERVFFVKVDPKMSWIMKVGQFPAWQIEGDSNIERLLGGHSDYYTKGLICESQGYGIGAFGYYRRIVEEIIDSLLMNPLGVLHSSLSEGLHAESDEICLEYAGKCREVLLFLVTQVSASKAAGRTFTEGMRKLLDKKAKNTS